jgi:plastocyanin
MKNKAGEIITRIFVVSVLALTSFLIFYFAPWKNNTGKRIIFLTAVAKNGVWTEETVNGANYWTKDFKQAVIILKKGEEVNFRFTSMDVTHSFYCPELNIGPVEVWPGKVYEIPFKADKVGSYRYYCTIVCGKCHFYMQGKIIILEDTMQITDNMIRKMKSDSVITSCCIPNDTLTLPDNIIEQGKYLFVIKNCVTCHGKEGIGGIKNYNYAKPTIPDLITLATKLKIPDKESADTIIKLLEKNADLEKLSDDPPFRNYDRFLAQYNSIFNKILNGAPIVLKADSTGPKPPLFMPSWENNLTKKEIRSIVSYLISKNNWEED